MVKIYNVYGSLSDFEYEEIDKTIKEDIINIPLNRQASLIMFIPVLKVFKLKNQSKIIPYL